MHETLVHEWHEFYVVGGTAAAALLGLLFVALTLNADPILTGERAHLERMAEQAFQNYTVVLIIALLFVMPHQSWRQLAAILTLIGAAMTAWAVYRLVRTRRISDDHFGLKRTLQRLLPSLVAYA